MYTYRYFIFLHDTLCVRLVMKHFYKKFGYHLSTKKHLYKNGVLGFLSVFIILVGIFVTTRGAIPHTSELSFIENSTSAVGSLVPASCNSTPPASHFAGDCYEMESCPYGEKIANWECKAYIYECPGGDDGCPGWTLQHTKYVNGVTYAQADSWCASAWPEYEHYVQYGQVDYNINPIPGTGQCPVPPPTIVSFSVSPTTIPYNSSATISWSSSGAESCTGGNFNTGGATGGSAGTGNLTSSQTYTLYCTNAGGNTATQSITVTVNPPSPTIVSFSVSPTTIPYNSSATISWSSSGAESCTGGNFNTGGATGGSAGTGNLTASQTYTLYCSTGGVNSATQSVTVTVGRPWSGNVPQPANCSIPAGASTCPINFSWTSSGLNSPDFTACGYTSPNYGGPCSVSYSTSYNANGSITYNVSGNGIYARISGTPDYYSYQDPVSSVVAKGICTEGSTWDGSVCACPAGYIAPSGVCINPLPVVSISPSGTIIHPINQGLLLSSLATDASSDITTHNLEWQTPTGASSPTWGTVSYDGLTTFPSGIGSSDLDATFTPDHMGQYRVRFAAQDNTLSNYNGEGPRWTYSSWTYINVISGTTAIIYPDPTNSSKLKWECFNSNQATLATTNGPTTNDFTNKTVPPASGTFTPVTGATYTLTCRNTASNQTSTFIYATPTFTSSNVGSTNATVAWNCNNATAQSVLIERFPGTDIAYNQTNANRTDNDLTPSTQYTYILRCFNQPNAIGSQVGFAMLNFTTNPSEPPAFTMSAYVRGTSSDPNTYSSTQPISALTPDGQFYDWSYRITGGVAQSCTMDQRNDGGAWYPNPAYASSPSSYTLLWSSLTASEKTGFAASFAMQHDWRLTCTDSEGKSGVLIWSLVKSDTFPTVIDASLNPACSGGSPTITVGCVNSDYYEVRNSANAIIASANATNGVVNLTGEDTYKVICKQGGSTGTASREVLRTYSASMCLTQANGFTATPVSLQSGGLSTLRWTITNPSASCTMTASPVCAGSGACSQARVAETDAINAGIANETILTDANDPNNINGIIRSVKDSVQTEAYNNGVAGLGLGKKTFRLNYTTDFTVDCGGGALQKLRVLITNDNEG